jgi:O-antigen ligase
MLVQGVAALVAIAIGWSVVQSGAFNKWLMPGKTPEQIATMHGRTDMWKRYYKGIKERPILGYGFPVGEKKARKLEDGTVFGTASAHNSVIGVAINTGIVGLVLVFIGSIQILLATNSSITAGRSGGITIVAVLATAFLNSMAYPVMGSHWFWPTTVVMGIVGIGVCYVWRPSNQYPSRQARQRQQTRA